MHTSLRTWSLACLAAAVLGAAGLAHAEEEFDVVVTKGTVKVTTKPGWHINQEYPWKLVLAEKKIDKSQFKLTPSTAVVEGATGSGKLKGAVCFGESQCKPFEKQVTVP